MLQNFIKRPISRKLKSNFIKGGLSLFLIGLLFWLSHPKELFDTPYSTVITDEYNQLLGAHIAQDGQWRFPAKESVPKRFKTAILTFEDEYFYSHFGVNPISLLGAAKTNIKTKKIVRGGSTLTMQVIRLARPAPRTFLNKALEIIKAVRLELAISKDSILSLYAAHAPFGGNTVGLEAAAWRYFNHPANELTWGETALLAVLPNAPGLMHPGRNQEQLKEKRNRLLTKLLEKEKIDTLTWQLSIAEPIPEKPQPLAQVAPHLLAYYLKNCPGAITNTTLDKKLQESTAEVIDRHSKQLKQNEIHNAAAIIAEVESGKILAYVGNSFGTKNSKGHNVDIILSNRSSGSILKPLLYSAALQRGIILPSTLLPDVPTYYTNYSPKNYQHQFDGAVAADEALSRSLNIPFIRLLDEFGGEPFLKTVRECGFTTFKNHYNHYGLSLILGGGENNLFELAGCYASMARTLNYYNNNSGTYSTNLNRPLIRSSSWCEKAMSEVHKVREPIFRAGAIYHTFLAMTQLQRPPEESGWEHFATSRSIAWKTGTSFGFRDGWAVGVTPEYVVAVWVGNASGEGRPGIIGGLTAGPILFELFNLLPPTSSFEIPYDDMIDVEVCSTSGHRPSIHCDVKESVWIPIANQQSEPCPYHQTVHLTPDGRYRTAQNISNDTFKTASFFVLPPLMEHYYQRTHPSYRTLPPYEHSAMQQYENPMDFIYPSHNSSFIIPKGIDGIPQKVVLRAVHRRKESSIYWHLNDEFIGTTTIHHDMEISPTVGKHIITIVDENGNKLSRMFNCLLN